MSAKSIIGIAPGLNLSVYTRQYSYFPSLTL
jgi:hypothetical protein